MNETLNQQKDTIIDIEVCIFQYPKTQTAINPYFPRQIGLGPYHHLRPDFYKMQNHKLAAAERVLRASPIVNSKELLIQKVKESELVIRGFYDQYIDLDGDTLAFIFAIDGLFLFDHLNNLYSYKNPKSGLIGESERKLARDIMIFENQIPLFLLLKLIGKFLLQYSGNDEIELVSESEMVDKIETSVFNFLQAHSPLELNHQAQFRHNTNNVHLLDHLYHLIVNNREMRRINTSDLIDDGKKIESSGAERVTTDDDVTPFQLILHLPWKDILASLKKSDKSESSPSVEEIAVPSATQLSSIGKINFSKTKGGIRDIKFEEEKLTMHLPVIKLNIDSEVILRNLMAYEASRGISKSVELAEYVDLMCGIVDTVGDVKLLREKGIIDDEGDPLSDEEIAKLFNGISKSSSGGKLKEMIQKINEDVESTATVKSFRSLQKYAYTSLKVLKVMAMVGFVLLLALQSICQIYGCSNRFFGYPNTLSLSYADS